MATRRFTSKEVAQLPGTYIGQYGELWIGDDDTVLRVGNNVTPGGVPISGGGGISGPETVCLPGVTTVVYTASSAAVRTIKVVAQATGYETGVVDFQDTHSADIMAIKNIRTGLGEVQVYGVTYSSVAPLVIFDAQITGGVLEVTATPTSLMNPITVNTLAVEISE